MIFVLVIVLVIMFLATKRITSEKMGNQMTSTRKPSTPYSRPEPAIRYSTSTKFVETPPGILRDGSPRPKNRRHISFDSIVTEKKYDVKTGAVSDAKLVKLES